MDSLTGGPGGRPGGTDLKVLAIIGGVVVAIIAALVFLSRDSGGPAPEKKVVQEVDERQGAVRSDSPYLTIALVDDVKVARDTDPNVRYGYTTRWLLNLIFDPFAKYSSDETVEPGRAPTGDPYDFRPVLADPKDVTVQSDAASRIGRFNAFPGTRFSNGIEFKVSEHFGNSIGNIREILRELGVSEVLKVSTEGDAVRAEYISFTSIRAVLWELVMSIPRIELARGGERLGTGPYRFDSREQNVTRLVANKMSKSYELGKMPEAIDFVYYQTVTNLLSANAEFDILISDHNPWAVRKTPMPSNLKTRLLPIGSHVFLFLNPRKIPSPAERQKIFASIFRKARNEVMRAGSVEQSGLIPNDLWFPNQWIATQALDLQTEGRLTASGFDRLVDDPGISMPTDRVYTMHLVGPFNENHPFIENVKALLGEQNVRITSRATLEDNWDSYDIVVFANDFDIVVGDPAQLLNVAPVRRVVQDVVRDNLQILSQLMFVHGRDNLPLAERFLAIQQSLVAERTVFPLFTSPVFLIYNTDRMKTLIANYREGFVRFPEWGFSFVR
jgi:hypothetical protein